MCVVVGVSVLRQRGRAETAMKNDMNDGLHAVLKVAHSSRGFVKVLILGLYSISVTHDGYTKHCNPGLFGILSITGPLVLVVVDSLLTPLYTLRLVFPSFS